jgi:mRNA interferase RelE/StbE
MSYTVKYTTKARKDLKNLPLDIAQTIIFSINSIKGEPYSYIKKIKGTKNHPLYTHRVGEYRVIMDIEDDRMLIMVIEAGHRSKIYRNY